MYTREDSSRNRSESHSTQFIWGLLIIALGFVFLARNFGYELDLLPFDRWWTAFIFLAALSPLNRARLAYRQSGQFTGEVLHPLVSAAAICTVGLILAMHLNWHKWWPLFVIFAGLWSIAKSRFDDRRDQNQP